MGSNWMPGARVMQAGLDGGAMGSGPKKVVWHTVEAPYTAKASDMAAYMNRVGYSVHLCWNPTTGEIVQMIPANRAGRGLVNKGGGVETNRGGSVVIQIEVVGKASNPFTNSACIGLDSIMNWLRSWGIPDVWPAGKPGGNDVYGPNPQRTTANWSKSGHFGHSQVPENDHWDPGKIDINKLLSAGTGGGTPTPPTSETYTVKKGDTLWGLSQAWKVTVAQIKSANGLTSDTLSVGQKLKVPGSTVRYVSFNDLPSTKIGSSSPIWTAMGKRLVAEGCGRYQEGPGPKLGQADINSYEAWQRKLGYTGDAAKWPPGPTSWNALKVPA